MGFLIKSVFWLSLVLLIIPIGGKNTDGTEAVSPIQAFFAAREAVGDIAGMCERKPEVCNVGRSAINTIGTRAKEGARIAVHMIGDEKPDMPADEVTGSIPTPRPSEDVAPAPAR